MHGLVSLLDPEHSCKVESLWDMLEAQCGLNGIRITPFPHFSWLIGADFDWPALEQALRELAAQTKPFAVQAGGLGIFPGPSPVFFIPVLRNNRLNHLHQAVWERVSLLGREVSEYYAPPNWMPHISLAYGDVTRENIDGVIRALAFQPIHWEITVSDLTLIYEPDGQVGEIRFRYPFGGG